MLVPINPVQDKPLETKPANGYRNAMPENTGAHAMSVAEGASAVASQELLERYYQKIGWWKGSAATDQARAINRAFWVGQGEVGTRWLAGRVGNETHSDVLDGVASLLAELGPISFTPVLEALGEKVTPEQAECLLTALRWISLPDRQNLPSGLVAILLRFLEHEQPDVREAAVRASCICPPREATQHLNQRREVETDPEVLAAIEQETDARATA